MLWDDPLTNAMKNALKRIAREDVFYDIAQIKEITDGNMGQSIIADAQSVADDDNSTIA